MAKKKVARTKEAAAREEQAVAKKKKKAAVPGQRPAVKTKKMTQKEAKEAYSPENILATSSAALAAITRRFAVEYGDPFITVAGEAGRIVVGVAIPFAFEYLIQNSVLPMGRMTCVVGETHSNKSALAYEFFRWLRPYGGQGYLIENESKNTPDLATSIVGYADEGPVTPWMHFPSYSVEDWQGKLQAVTDSLRADWTKKSEANPYPPGRVFPAVIALDSIMGKLSEESQAKIEQDGHAGRAFAHEALIITSYLKKFPQDIAAWPIHFVAINHLKKHKAEHGHHMERNKSGGKHIDFQQTFELELSRLKKIELVDQCPDDGFKVGGNLIQMRCYKNGLGEDQHRIAVPIIWYNRKFGDDPKPRQYTRWDWDSAAVDLLTGFKEATYLNKIREICDVHQATGGKFWSKALGVTKNDALPKSDLGRLLTRDRPIRNALRDLFGIKQRKVFQKGVDYLEQIEVLREDVEDSMDNMDDN